MDIIILSSLYLILPSYLANIAALVAGKLNLPLGKPINEKLLGRHKTWRGFYAGVIGALLVLLLQDFLHKNGNYMDYSLIDYSNVSIILYSLLFGLGTATGDSIKSYFKRRLKIKPGDPWFPFDQVDLVLGTYLFLLPVFIMPWENLLTLLVITPVLHLLANLTAFGLGLKKVWW